jgi:hypothetical protein
MEWTILTLKAPQFIIKIKFLSYEIITQIPTTSSCR